jgi:hypothetical protein
LQHSTSLDRSSKDVLYTHTTDSECWTTWSTRNHNVLGNRTAWHSGPLLSWHKYKKAPRFWQQTQRKPLFYLQWPRAVRTCEWSGVVTHLNVKAKGFPVSQAYSQWSEESHVNVNPKQTVAVTSCDFPQPEAMQYKIWLLQSLNVKTEWQELLLRFQSESVRVRVTLLTVSQSVCLDVEPHLGLMTRYLIFIVKVTVLSIWGALSGERSGLSLVSQSIVFGHLSVYTYNIFTKLNKILIYNMYKASVSPGSVQQIMPYF